MTDILMRPVVRLQVALAELREREDGQTTTEYAILLGFLAIAIIIALYFLRNVLRDLFSDAASSVSNPGRCRSSTGLGGRAPAGISQRLPRSLTRSSASAGNSATPIRRSPPTST